MSHITAILLIFFSLLSICIRCFTVPLFGCGCGGGRSIFCSASFIIAIPAAARLCRFGALFLGRCKCLSIFILGLRLGASQGTQKRRSRTAAVAGWRKIISGIGSATGIVSVTIRVTIRMGFCYAGRIARGDVEGDAFVIS